MKAAKAAAKEELRLAKDAAKAEIAVLKDDLNAALKRERELVKISENKIKAMVSAGEKWERQQMNKLKKMMARKKTR